MLRCLRKCGQRAWQRRDVLGEWTYDGDYDDDDEDEEVEEEKEYDTDCLVMMMRRRREREVDCPRLISARASHQALPSFPYFYFSSSDQTFTFHLLNIVLLFIFWSNFHFSSLDHNSTFLLLAELLVFISWSKLYFSSLDQTFTLGLNHDSFLLKI